MARKEFIEELDDKGYSYEIEGNKIIVTDGGSIDLRYLKSLPQGVEFRYGASIDLNSLETIPQGVEFHVGRNVYLGSLIGGYFMLWDGNIEGIRHGRLLNKMISLGLFDKKK